VFGSLDDDGVTRLQTVDVTQVATGAMTGIGAVAYGSGHDGGMHLCAVYDGSVEGGG